MEMEMIKMDLETILKGIKPIKQQPDDKGFPFDKTKPIGAYNFPMSKFTVWKAFGYKIDDTGFKTPYWITKTLPTGVAFIPDLDQVISVDGKEQIF